MWSWALTRMVLDTDGIGRGWYWTRMVVGRGWWLDADGGWTRMVVECGWLPVECGWWLDADE